MMDVERCGWKSSWSVYNVKLITPTTLYVVKRSTQQAFKLIGHRVFGYRHTKRQRKGMS